MSVVVPAYNEEDRLGVMLTEAVEHLEQEYGYDQPPSLDGKVKGITNGTANGTNRHTSHSSSQKPRGWEILIVSDGSTDRTIDTALEFARNLGAKSSASIRVISLRENRGKGGAVTHGMRHVRGDYAVFADADGASRFMDLGKLVQACQEVEDEKGRGIAVGSRAHLVGSEAVVKVRSVWVYTCVSILMFLAFVSTQLLDALLPRISPLPDTSCHSRYTRYTVRL